MNFSPLHVPRDFVLSLIILFSIYASYIMIKSEGFSTDRSINFYKLGIPPLKQSLFLRRGAQNVIFDLYGTSSLKNGSFIDYKRSRSNMLCKLKNEGFCLLKEPAEVIDKFIAVAPIYYINQNNLDFLIRYHVNFINYLSSIGIRTIVVEGINEEKNQKYLVTKPNNEPWEIQRTIEYSFYQRENLLNFVAKKYPELWEYLIWIDGHQIFENLYWWEEAIIKMEKYAGVQFFHQGFYLHKDNFTNYRDFPSTLYNYSVHSKLHHEYHFAGNAWGIRKEMYQKIGFILDYCIASCCDYAYTMASLKDPDDWDGIDYMPHYKKALWPWVVETNKIFQGKSAFIRGKLIHLWHEHLFNYDKFNKRLNTMRFDPDIDIYRDDEFIIHLKSDRIKAVFAGV